MRHALEKSVAGFVSVAITASLATAAVANTPVAHPASVSRPGTQSHVRKQSLGTPPMYFGGGATFPGPGYAGSGALTANLVTPSYNKTTTTSERSMLGYWVNKLVATPVTTTATYCLTGSGFGRGVIDGADPNASLPCPAFGVAPVKNVNGFSADLGGTPQTFADFAGSDSPFGQTDWTNFYNDSMPGGDIAGRGLDVQVPALVGAVAVVYNEAGITGTLNLDETTGTGHAKSIICQIADGEVTTWNQIPGVPSTDTNPITFVYRSDGSGTSFTFLNHLAKLCVTHPNTETYSAQNAYLTGLPSPNPGNTSGFVGESGNNAVFAYINATPHTIGYVEYGYYQDSTSPTAMVATVTNASNTTPVTPDSVAVTAGHLNTVTFVTGEGVVSNVNSQPTLAPLIDPTPTGGCVVVVPPTDYANILTNGGYPIIGVTYLNFSTAGNGSAAADLQKLAKMTLTNTYFVGHTGDIGKKYITTVDPAASHPAPGTGTGYTTLSKIKTSNKTILTTAAGCIGA